MIPKRLDDGLGHGAVVRVGLVGVEEGDPGPVVLQEQRGRRLGRERGRRASASECGVQGLPSGLDIYDFIYDSVVHKYVPQIAQDQSRTFLFETSVHTCPN